MFTVWKLNKLRQNVLKIITLSKSLINLLSFHLHAFFTTFMAVSKVVLRSLFV